MRLNGRSDRRAEGYAAEGSPAEFYQFHVARRRLHPQIILENMSMTTLKLGRAAVFAAEEDGV